MRADDVQVRMQGEILTVSAARRPAHTETPVQGEPELAVHPEAALFEGMASLPAPVRALETGTRVDGETVTVTVPRRTAGTVERKADLVRRDELRAAAPRA